MDLEKIASLLAEKVDVDASEITLETSFDEIGLDSLDIVELLMSLESECGVSLEPDPEVKTVGDLLEKIENLSK